MSVQRPVIALSPQMPVLGGINQLCRDPHLVVLPCVHCLPRRTARPSSLLSSDNFTALPFVGEGRVAGDNKKTREA